MELILFDNKVVDGELINTIEPNDKLCAISETFKIIPTYPVLLSQYPNILHTFNLLSSILYMVKLVS